MFSDWAEATGVNVSTSSSDENAILDDVTGLPIDATQEALLREQVLRQIPTVPYLSYIENVGDELAESMMSVDIAQYIPAETLKQIEIGLTYIPRQHFTIWYDKNIGPVIDPQYNGVVKKSFLALFNRINLAEINRRGITPWEWEQIKMRATYQQASDAEIESGTSYLNLTASQLLAESDSKQISALSARYELLPKAGSEELEINRQAAIVGLLNQKEFALVDQILKAYESATDYENALVENPPNIATEILAQKEIMPVSETPSFVNPQLPLTEKPTTFFSRLLSYFSYPQYQNPMAIFFVRK